jgi:LacI family transcriptional regulator
LEILLERFDMKDKKQIKQENITMVHVADRANVSIATVSNVLNNTKAVSENLKKKVYDAIGELNYKPNYYAQSMRRKSGNILGIVIPEIRNSFYAEIIRGVEDIAFEKGYSVFICNSDNDPRKWKMYVDMLYSKRVDGVIITGAWLDKDAAWHFLVNKGIPLTIVNFDSESSKADIVGISRYQGGVKAGEYLLGLGHRDIVVFEGRKNYIPSKTFNPVQGAKDVLQNNGIENVKSVICNSFTLEGGYLGMQQVLQDNERPTAVFCENDLLALGAMRAVFDNNLKVPEDISVIGIDNIAFSGYGIPRLTTIDTSRYRLGTLATEMIFDRIKDPLLPRRRQILNPEIIVRESTAKLLK